MVEGISELSEGVLLGERYRLVRRLDLFSAGAERVAGVEYEYWIAEDVESAAEVWIQFAAADGVYAEGAALAGAVAALRRINHPAVPAVPAFGEYEFEREGEIAAVGYCAIPTAAGETLAAALLRGERDQAEVLVALGQVAEVLELLAEFELVHGHLSAHSVLLSAAEGGGYGVVLADLPASLALETALESELTMAADVYALAWLIVLALVGPEVLEAAFGSGFAVTTEAELELLAAEVVGRRLEWAAENLVVLGVSAELTEVLLLALGESARRPRVSALTVALRAEWMLYAQGVAEVEEVAEVEDVVAAEAAAGAAALAAVEVAEVLAAAETVEVIEAEQAAAAAGTSPKPKASQKAQKPKAAQESPSPKTQKSKAVEAAEVAGTLAVAGAVGVLGAESASAATGAGAQVAAGAGTAVETGATAGAAAAGTGAAVTGAAAVVGAVEVTELIPKIRPGVRPGSGSGNKSGGGSGGAGGTGGYAASGSVGYGGAAGAGGAAGSGSGSGGGHGRPRRGPHPGVLVGAGLGVAIIIVLVIVFSSSPSKNANAASAGSVATGSAAAHSATASASASGSAAASGTATSVASASVGAGSGAGASTSAGSSAGATSGSTAEVGQAFPTTLVTVPASASQAVQQIQSAAGQAKGELSGAQQSQLGQAISTLKQEISSGQSLSTGLAQLWTLLHSNELPTSLNTYHIQLATYLSASQGS